MLKRQLGSICSQEDYSLIKEAAGSENRSISKFILIASLEKARKVLGGEKEGDQ